MTFFQPKQVRVQQNALLTSEKADSKPSKEAPDTAANAPQKKLSAPAKKSSETLKQVIATLDSLSGQTSIPVADTAKILTRHQQIADALKAAKLKTEQVNLLVDPQRAEKTKATGKSLGEHEPWSESPYSSLPISSEFNPSVQVLPVTTAQFLEQAKKLVQLYEEVLQTDTANASPEVKKSTEQLLKKIAETAAEYDGVRLPSMVPVALRMQIQRFQQQEKDLPEAVKNSPTFQNLLKKIKALNEAPEGKQESVPKLSQALEDVSKGMAAFYTDLEKSIPQDKTLQGALLGKESAELTEALTGALKSLEQTPLAYEVQDQIESALGMSDPLPGLIRPGGGTVGAGGNDKAKAMIGLEKSLGKTIVARGKPLQGALKSLHDLPDTSPDLKSMIRDVYKESEIQNPKRRDETLQKLSQYLKTLTDAQKDSKTSPLKEAQNLLETFLADPARSKIRAAHEQTVHYLGTNPHALIHLMGNTLQDLDQLAKDTKNSEVQAKASAAIQNWNSPNTALKQQALNDLQTALLPVIQAQPDSELGKKANYFIQLNQGAVEGFLRQQDAPGLKAMNHVLGESPAIAKSIQQYLAGGSPYQLGLDPSKTAMKTALQDSNALYKSLSKEGQNAYLGVIYATPEPAALKKTLSEISTFFGQSLLPQPDWEKQISTTIQNHITTHGPLPEALQKELTTSIQTLKDINPDGKTAAKGPEILSKHLALLKDLQSEKGLERFKLTPDQSKHFKELVQDLSDSTALRFQTHVGFKPILQKLQQKLANPDSLDVSDHASIQDVLNLYRQSHWLSTPAKMKIFQWTQYRLPGVDNKAAQNYEDSLVTLSTEIHQARLKPKAKDLEKTKTVASAQSEIIQALAQDQKALSWHLKGQLKQIAERPNTPEALKQKIQTYSNALFPNREQWESLKNDLAKDLKISADDYAGQELQRQTLEGINFYISALPPKPVTPKIEGMNAKQAEKAKEAIIQAFAKVDAKYLPKDLKAFLAGEYFKKGVTIPSEDWLRHTSYTMFYVQNEKGKEISPQADQAMTLARTEIINASATGGGFNLMSLNTGMRYIQEMKHTSPDLKAMIESSNLFITSDIESLKKLKNRLAEDLKSTQETPGSLGIKNHTLQILEAVLTAKQNEPKPVIPPKPVNDPAKLEQSIAKVQQTLSKLDFKSMDSSARYGIEYYMEGLAKATTVERKNRFLHLLSEALQTWENQAQKEETDFQKFGDIALDKAQSYLSQSPAALSKLIHSNLNLIADLSKTPAELKKSIQVLAAKDLSETKRAELLVEINASLLAEMNEQEMTPPVLALKTQTLELIGQHAQQNPFVLNSQLEKTLMDFKKEFGQLPGDVKTALESVLNTSKKNPTDRAKAIDLFSKALASMPEGTPPNARLNDLKKVYQSVVGHMAVTQKSVSPPILMLDSFQDTVTGIKDAMKSEHDMFTKVRDSQAKQYKDMLASSKEQIRTHLGKWMTAYGNSGTSRMTSNFRYLANGFEDPALYKNVIERAKGLGFEPDEAKNPGFFVGWAPEWHFKSTGGGLLKRYEDAVTQLEKAKNPQEMEKAAQEIEYIHTLTFGAPGVYTGPKNGVRPFQVLPGERPEDYLPSGKKGSTKSIDYVEVTDELYRLLGTPPRVALPPGTKKDIQVYLYNNPLTKKFDTIVVRNELDLKQLPPDAVKVAFEIRRNDVKVSESAISEMQKDMADDMKIQADTAPWVQFGTGMAILVATGGMGAKVAIPVMIGSDLAMSFDGDFSKTLERAPLSVASALLGAGLGRLGRAGIDRLFTAAGGKLIPQLVTQGGKQFTQYVAANGQPVLSLMRGVGHHVAVPGAIGAGLGYGNMLAYKELRMPSLQAQSEELAKKLKAPNLQAKEIGALTAQKDLVDGELEALKELPLLKYSLMSAGMMIAGNGVYLGANRFFNPIRPVPPSGGLDGGTGGLKLPSSPLGPQPGGPGISLPQRITIPGSHVRPYTPSDAEIPFHMAV